MSAEIKIKGDYKTIAGTTEWLQQQIENSEFLFASTSKNEPCVIWRVFKKRKDVDSERILLKSTVVAYISAEVEDTYGYREYNETRIIHTDGNGYSQVAMFEYLTLNAKRHCDSLIKRLADELVRKMDNDRANLKIIVTVE